MMHDNAKKSVVPIKAILALFLFGLVILTGKIIYTQFDTLSVNLGTSLENPEQAAMVTPELFNQTAMQNRTDIEPGLTLYRSEIARADVLWFYTHITGNEAITRVILDNAARNNIPLPLAFALAWGESRYQPKAVNKNATSIDRGLFQLNNKSFPKLVEKDFFNIDTNSYHGLAHLRYCLDLSGNEITALAMYNAGATKVKSDKTPKKTLDYISQITTYRDGLERLFNQQVLPRYRIDPKSKEATLNRQ